MDGTSKLYSRPCYGYRLDRNGEFTIVQEEAEVVKLVFNLYLDGLSILGIMRELEQRGIPSPSGKAKWCRRSIDLLLENEKYRGNSVATAPTMSDAPKDLPRRRYLLSIDRDFILELGSLYLDLVTQLEVRKLQIMLAEEKQPRGTAKGKRGFWSLFTLKNQKSWRTG